MERAARRFASWVLGLHLLGLLALVLIVIYVSFELYSNTRRQAMEQMRIRQELLAGQAARGIEEFYRSVLEDMELQRRAPVGTVSEEVMRALIWEQLRGRASQLIEVDAATVTPIARFSDETEFAMDELLKSAAEWLRTVKAPAVSHAIPVKGKSSVLIAMPTSGPSANRLLMAVVPLRAVESRFLNTLNEPQSMSATLVDDRVRVLSADAPGLVGTDMTSAASDPRIREVANEFMQQGQRGTREFLEPMTVAGVKLEPALATMQPVVMPDGKRWWLAVSSGLAAVDNAVRQFLRRTVAIAGLIVLGGTAVLVSTSTQIIRERLRLERVQREALTRELDQAREIQLMWLPERQETEVALDVSAVNRPASHISGDFYNWFELPDGRTCVVIGDVTGHGLPAAFLMATTQLLVRTSIIRLQDPGRSMREVNRQLCQHVFSGQFVTLLILVIDPARGSIELATAGHPAPIAGTDGEYAPLKVDPELVLAIDRDVSYTTQRFELPLDASVLLYTDGVTDVENVAGDRLDPSGLQTSLFGRFSSAKTIVESVLDRVDEFRGTVEPKDDLTLVAIRFAKTPAGGNESHPQAVALAAKPT